MIYSDLQEILLITPGVLAMTLCMIATDFFDNALPKTQQVINVTCTGSPNLPHWHLVWAWTNGKTCNLIFAIIELKQHLLSLVQTTIGFGDPCRTGSCSP